MTEIVTGSLSNDFSKFVDEFSGLASQADTVKTLLLNEFKFEREHWIVRQNGTAVATVAVCLSQVLQKTAYVGFYENKAVSDRELICKILFKNVYNWCHIKSVEKIHGPINYSTWFSYRYCLQEYAETFSWEPENSTEYLNDFRAEGFSDSENYFSVAFTGLKKVSEMTAATYAQIEQKYGVYCREFDLKKNYEKELESALKINRAAFEKTFLVEPITDADYEKFIFSALSKVDLRFSCMIESKKDGPIGYFFCFLDRGYIVWKTVALLPSYQGMGLTNSAVHWVCKRAVESGYEKLICALMKKDAPSVPLMKKVSNELWSHEYLVLGKSL